MVQILDLFGSRQSQRAVIFKNDNYCEIFGGTGHFECNLAYFYVGWGGFGDGFGDISQQFESQIPGFWGDFIALGQGM